VSVFVGIIREGGREGGRTSRYLEASVGRVFDGLIDVTDSPEDKSTLVEGIATRHGEGLSGACLSVWRGRREGGREGGRE